METILANNDGKIQYRVMSSWDLTEEDLQTILAGRQQLQDFVYKVTDSEPVPQDPNSRPSYFKTDQYLRDSPIISIFSSIGLKLHLIVYSRHQECVLLDLIVGFLRPPAMNSGRKIFFEILPDGWTGLARFTRRLNISYRVVETTTTSSNPLVSSTDWLNRPREIL